MSLVIRLARSLAADILRSAHTIYYAPRCVLSSALSQAGRSCCPTGRRMRRAPDSR